VQRLQQQQQTFMGGSMVTVCLRICQQAQCRLIAAEKQWQCKLAEVERDLKAKQDLLTSEQERVGEVEIHVESIVANLGQVHADECTRSTVRGKVYAPLLG
jgi:hypothetical protein